MSPPPQLSLILREQAVSLSISRSDTAEPGWRNARRQYLRLKITPKVRGSLRVFEETDTTGGLPGVT